MESATEKIAITKLPIGAKLLVRSKVDWRTAVISKASEEYIYLRVCSPKGRTYIKRCPLETFLDLDGDILVLMPLEKELWRGNYAKYDARW
jgi:hypothetical protein